MEEDFKAMKSHGVTRGRHSPPFLLIGLVVVIVILSLNYWSASTRLADLQQKDDQLRQTFRDELQLKKELQANNEMLESRVKKSQETYDSLRQSLDKKEEEALQCKETHASLKRDFNVAKSEDEQKIVAVEEKLRRAKENITQQIQIHDQDGSVVASLREENSKLSAQLSALQESLNHALAAASSSPQTAAAAASNSERTADCNQHCLVLVEAAQERLFKKIVAKFGQDALLVLKSADFGIPRRPGKLLTGAPPPGKLAEDILVVGRDGKIESGSLPAQLSPANDTNNIDNKDSSRFLAAKPSSTTPSSAAAAAAAAAAAVANVAPRPLSNLLPLKLDDAVDAKPINGVAEVGAAPPDPNRKLDDDNVGILGAAVADAAGAAAVAQEPPLSIDEEIEKSSKRNNAQVDDVVDGDAEAGGDDDDEDGDAAGRIGGAADAAVADTGMAAGVADAAIAAPVAARQEPLLVRDGIDQLHNNLAADDQTGR